MQRAMLGFLGWKWMLWSDDDSRHQTKMKNIVADLPFSDGLLACVNWMTWRTRSSFLFYISPEIVRFIVRRHAAAEPFVWNWIMSFHIFPKCVRFRRLIICKSPVSTEPRPGMYLNIKYFPLCHNCLRFATFNNSSAIIHSCNEVFLLFLRFLVPSADDSSECAWMDLALTKWLIGFFSYFSLQWLSFLFFFGNASKCN